MPPPSLHYNYNYYNLSLLRLLMSNNYEQVFGPPQVRSLRLTAYFRLPVPAASENMDSIMRRKSLQDWPKMAQNIFQDGPESDFPTDSRHPSVVLLAFFLSLPWAPCQSIALPYVKVRCMPPSKPKTSKGGTRICSCCIQVHLSPNGSVKTRGLYLA